ncbi:MAG TPA: asparagine synthase-related protein [Magnetovibrio sp.]
MSRIIGLFRRKPGAALDGVDLQAGVDFVSHYVTDPLVVDQADSADGRFSLRVVRRQSERERTITCPDTGIILAFDGGPQMNDRLLSAQDLLQMWRERGTDFAIPLDGGWTIAVYDQNAGQVTLVRDHLGAKPLYYAEQPALIGFASGAGMLVRAGLASSRLDTLTASRYLTCNYKTHYGRSPTIFDDVKIIPWGTSLQADEHASSIKRYWDMPDDAPFYDPAKMDVEAQYRDVMRDALRQSQTARAGQRSCIALSGGVDSGTIAGFMHELTGERVDALSMTYGQDTPFDETKLINCTVRDHIATWHNVKLGWQDLAADLDTMYERFETPLTTISMYGYDFLAKKARELGYSVLYTGSGGDYPQAGTYPALLFNLADLRAGSDPAAYEREVDAWIRRHSTAAYPKTRQTAEDFIRTHTDPKSPGGLVPFALWLDGPDLLSADVRRTIGSVEAETVRNYGTYLRSYTMQGYLFESAAAATDPEDVMDWTYGTDTTSPLVCESVIQLGWRLPNNQKIEDGVNKVLARRALRGVVPDEILDEVNKGGFNAPTDDWFRNELRDYVLDAFNSRTFRERGFYNLERFDALISQHMKGEANHMMLLWQALNFELWARKWKPTF